MVRICSLAALDKPLAWSAAAPQAGGALSAEWHQRTQTVDKWLILMSFDTLTPQQQAFIERYLSGSLFSKKKDKKTVGSYEAYLEKEAEFKALAQRIPSSHPAMQAIITDTKPAIDLKNDGKFDEAANAMAGVIQRAKDLELSLKDERQSLIGQASRLRLAAGATEGDTTKFTQARDAVAAALPDAVPTMAQLKAGMNALDAAKALIPQIDRLTALAAKNPQAAAAAHTAFDEMARKAGGARPTPENIKTAGEAVEAAKTAAKEADRALELAQAMPTVPLSAVEARDEALEAARKQVEEAKAALKDAEDKESGLLGTKMLTDALVAGPLSANTGAPFADAVAKQFIEGFQKDPRLTAMAVETATGSRHPEAVAAALASVGDQVANGFADGEGNPLPDGVDPRDYAEKIVKMGAHCGKEYFDRLDAYIETGGHLKESGFKENPDDKLNAKSQKRSVAVAGAMLDGDGKLKPDSDAAKAAIGNMLFHPDAFDTPMPTMTDTTLRTIEELRKPKAAEIIAGMKKPEEGGGAESLVALALGTDGPVTADQARTAVLATMFKSLDQGPVGSCFSTAPSRNLREGQPLVAMEKFAQIASEGKLSTATGLPTPVVTEIPEGEDPIMRSLEYTLATALARNSASSQYNTIQNRNMAGIDAIRGNIATALGKEQGEIGGDIFKVMIGVRKGFRVQYDPTAELDEVSGDGSSSQGRHVLVDVASGEVMTSREKYVAAVTPRVLAALNLEPDSDEAKALKPKIEADFVDAMVETKSDGTVDSAPWKMATGGKTVEAVEQLFGELDDKVATSSNYKLKPNGQYDLDDKGRKIPLSDTREKQGPRTLAVLEGLFGTFGDDPNDMIVVRTTGIHGFNALPNHPSLKPLLEGDGTMDEKLKAALVDPGTRIATTKMSVQQAQKHYDENAARERATIQRWHDKAAEDKKEHYVTKLRDFNAKIARLRPAEGLTPKELTDLVVELRKDFFGKPELSRAKAATSMMQDLGCPEIFIADTNWGKSTHHTYIVAAPDPVSGQPILWKKVDPPGKLSELDPKWIDASWAASLPKT